MILAHDQTGYFLSMFDLYAVLGSLQNLLSGKKKKKRQGDKDTHLSSSFQI